MDYRVENLTEEDVMNIISWKYVDDYSIYNFPSYEIMKKENWAILNQEKRNEQFRKIIHNNELIGWFRFQGNDEITIGLGMKPSLCGKNNGKYFIKTILDYINKKNIVLIVREFNKRAINCYKSCGFKEIDRFYKENKVEGAYFIKMKYDSK